MVPISVLLMVEILVATSTVAVAAGASGWAMANTLVPHCRDKCGDITIPYPFGVGDGCFLEGFEMRCDYSTSPPKLLMDTGNNGSIEVVEIFLSGELRIRTRVGRSCHDDSGAVQEIRTQSIDLTSTPFAFSHTKNKFAAVGCDTVASVAGVVRTNIKGLSLPLRYAGGCVSRCYTRRIRSAAAKCDGMGCCEASIPRGLKQFSTSLRSNFNYSDADVWGFSKCGYAFVAEQGRGHEYLQHGDFRDGVFDAKLSVILDWSVGNLPCYPGIERRAGYACRSKNSECIDAANPGNEKTSLGYRCRCAAGFEGNPYLEHGCKDVDESKDVPSQYPCGGICGNAPGGDDCSCPPGTVSLDPKESPSKFLPVKRPVTGTPNRRRVQLLPYMSFLGLGICLTFALATMISRAHRESEERRHKQVIRHKLFRQNARWPPVDHTS